MKISIVCMFKNNEEYVLFFSEKMRDIEKKYIDISFEYFLYENDSTDHTLEMLEMFMKNRLGKLFTEKNRPVNNFQKSISIERGIFMKNLRNNLKRLHGKLDSDFVLLLDTDTIFIETIVYNYINYFKVHLNVAMVTPYCLDWKTMKEGMSNHYYDTLALIYNNMSYLETGNTCLFQNCQYCPLLRTRYNKNDPLQQLKFSHKNNISVQSALGCVSMIRTPIYNQVEWGDSICEHHSFCKNIRRYGEIHLLTNVFAINSHIQQYSNTISFFEMEKFLN